jgi:hypothetical protein
MSGDTAKSLDERPDRASTVVIAAHVHEDVAREFYGLIGQHLMTTKAAVHEMLALFFDAKHHPRPARLNADLAKPKKGRPRR